MESLIAPPTHSTDARLGRRSVLAAAASLGLSFALPPLPARAADRRGEEREKSLLVLWMQGGMSQLESFDPHPGSPIGGPTKAIATSLKGTQFADLFERTAEHAHKLNLIRSMTSAEGDHERATYFLKTGYRPDPTVRHPAAGAVAASAKPAEGLAIPAHVALNPGQWPPRGGYLGPGLDAFQVHNPGGPPANLRDVAQPGRRARRLAGLDVLSQSFSAGRPGQLRRTRHAEATDEAVTMMDSPQVKAFEIEDEPDVLKAAYGDTRFGRGCLVARRLIETGVRAVEVTLNGFDTHADNFGGMATQAETLDPALAALLGDLADRDLLESTVVLVMTEFGRTPRINPLDGRDHWPKGFSCMVGGGGLASGRVIGGTDPLGEKEPTDPVSVQDLYATVYSALGIEPDYEEMTPIGRPLKRVEGTPLASLFA
ncbi:DUF1501 domain-containing protein [Alienimonas chondri]|uniref:DUF1501 domain-containing protein n=1 Tax=Alienimonas chondri TaxID=2681879 RepID=A0ABX1V9W2_9PLAN|nr:DUF1501 domain-containing protein [Alienimonas chondri]NNJ24544.1 hypothetical protein [Alienimonas chondri]